MTKKNKSQADIKYFENQHIDIFQHNPLPEYFLLIEKAGDDRSRVITMNLILEEQIDLLLSLLIRYYEENIKSDLGFNHDKKIKLLNSFNLLPNSLFQATACLQEVRNKFAHNLKCKTLVDLPIQVINRINKTYQEVKYSGTTDDSESIEGKIKEIQTVAMFGFHGYTPNISNLRDQIASERFKKELESQSREKFLSQWNSLQIDSKQTIGTKNQNEEQLGMPGR